MKGCQLQFDPGGVGSVSIAPSGCGPVSFGIWGCGGSFTISGGTDIDAAYLNTGSGSEAGVEIEIDDSSVEYVSPNNYGCASKGTHSNLHLQGTLTVAASDGKGQSVGVSAVTGGLYVGGPAEAGRFEAPEYPVGVAGERVESGPFKGEVVLLQAGPYSTKVTCTVAQYDGGELSEAASSLTLTAAYSGCRLGGSNTTVNMNSCHYVYSCAAAASNTPATALAVNCLAYPVLAKTAASAPTCS